MSAYPSTVNSRPTGWWEWFKTEWSRRRASGTVTRRMEIPEVVSAPARGDLFMFTAETALLWRADGMSREQLDLVVVDLTTRVGDFVERVIARMSRRFQADEADRFQTELNDELAARDLRYSWGRHEIHCRAFVQIGVDEQVRTALRPTMLDRLRQTREFETKMKRIELVDNLSNMWSTLLNELKDKPHITHAAELTDRELATVLAKLDQTREHDSDELRRILRDAVDGSDDLSIGAYEWARAYDKLINQQPRTAEVVDEAEAGAETGDDSDDDPEPEVQAT